MQPTPPDKQNNILRNIIAVFALLEAFAIVVVGGFCLLHGKATGIVTGYEEAAARAYQMGRPLPDTIFETGMFRIAITSQSSSATDPFRVHVAVKDRIFNTVLYNHVRRVEILR